MSIEEVKKINNAWEEWFHAIYDPGDLPSYWHYRPFSNEYWNEKNKIVLCNEEPYGDSEERCYLELDKYKNWLEEGIRTAKFSAVFLYSLYKQLHNISITEKQLRELYHNNNELLNGIRNTTYMNLRKTEKWKAGTKEDKDSIIRSLVHDKKYDERDKDGECNKFNRKLTLEFIDALEPNIFIITGVDIGLFVLKDIYTDKLNNLNSLQKYGMYKTENTLFVSMKHLSRIDYNYILQKTGAIYDELQKQPN